MMTMLYKPFNTFLFDDDDDEEKIMQKRALLMLHN